MPGPIKTVVQPSQDYRVIVQKQCLFKRAQVAYSGLVYLAPGAKSFNVYRKLRMMLSNGGDGALSVF